MLFTKECDYAIAAEYAGTGNETKISCRIISVSVFLP